MKFKKNVENYLLENRLNVDLFWHGIDIIVSDGIGFISALFLSTLFHNTIPCLLYIASFSMLRVYSGGYHSSTRINCFILYNVLFILYSLIENTFIFTNIIFNGILLFISALIILRYAPVQHIYAPLTPVEKYRNIRVVRFTLSFLLILYIIFLWMKSPYYKPISISIMYTSFLMFLHMNTKFYRK